MRRGEIWWANLREPVGSEPGYRRPVVILQSDDFNRSRIGTVIAMIVTSNLKLAEAPGNVFLHLEDTGLPKDSVGNVSQLITLDRGFLSECVGSLSPSLMEQVEEGVRLVLALS